MKPNWKKLSKESYSMGYAEGVRVSYEKGYAEGVKRALEWTPATNPPKKSGEYMVLRADLQKGIDRPDIRRTTWFYNAGMTPLTGHWDTLPFGGVILYWCELPEIPGNVGISVTLTSE